MYVKKSVSRPEGNQGRSLMVRDAVDLIDVEDIKVFPQPDSNGVRIADDIILNDGAYAMSVYLTPGTAEVTEPSDGDPDQEGFTPQVKFNHPGNTLAVREFKHNCINKKFIVIVRHCDGSADLFGSPCNPARLQTSYTGNKDGNTNEITLVQSFKGDGLKVYEGTVPEETTKSYSNKSGTVTFNGDGQYQANSSDVVTAIEKGTDGAVITILGSSDSSNATVINSKSAEAAGSNILLKNGTATLTAGSQITLRAFDTGNGIVWIEQSRYVA